MLAIDAEKRLVEEFREVPDSEVSDLINDMRTRLGTNVRIRVDGTTIDGEALVRGPAAAPRGLTRPPVQILEAKGPEEGQTSTIELQFSDLQAELLATLDETERLVEDASRVLSEHLDRLAHVAGDLLDTAGLGVDTVVQAIDDFGRARDVVFEELCALMQQVADALGQSDSVLLSDWGSSIEQLGQGADQLFVQDLGSSLRTDADQLAQALCFLQGNADRLSDVFGGDVGDLLNALKEISGLIERIKPLLEQVEMLL